MFILFTAKISKRKTHTSDMMIRLQNLIIKKETKNTDKKIKSCRGPTAYMNLLKENFGTHCVYLSSNDNQDYFGYLFSVIRSLYW